MKSFIAFPNFKQASIFENELKGQLSDGFWENARPYNHWESICAAEVKVSDKPAKQFDQQKNYNFTDKALIDIVGERMWKYAIVADHFKEKFPIHAYGFICDYVEKIIQIYTTGKNDNEYVVHQIKRYEIKLKDALKVKQLIDDNPFNKDTLKALKNELLGIKKLVNK